MNSFVQRLSYFSFEIKPYMIHFTRHIIGFAVPCSTQIQESGVN
jgi:hypothetical protein